MKETETVLSCGTFRKWLFCCCILLLTEAPASAFQAAAPAPGDVQGSGEDASAVQLYAKVALLQRELDLIRREMGRPDSGPAVIRILEATPREVYFQSLTMLQKAGRLSFELTREQPEIPPIQQGDILLSHVEQIVDSTLACMRNIKGQLNISEHPSPPPVSGSWDESDLFQAVMQINRRLNLLLDRQFSPSDVYRQVTMAVSYASRLLALFPEAERIPPAPPFARGKVPGDVYLRLIDCFQRIQEIARSWGHRIPELEVDRQEARLVASSDVYDLASLLVSELAFLHRLAGNAAPPRDVYWPGRKFPSHVYQRACLLEAQLIEIQRHSRRQAAAGKRQELEAKPTQGQ